jgi:glycosyltransferase involved in cell wall biosynthesis
VKIVHVSTFERAGGAAIAASRLHIGLRALGHESTLLVRDATADDHAPDTIVLGGDICGPIGSPTLLNILYSTFERRRLPGSDRLFSTDLPTRALAEHPAIKTADVVNIHWVSGFTSVPAIRAVQDLGKPVVWTLHDQAAFTGGCHYSGGCVRFERGCEPCPELRHDAQHVPGLLLRHKRRWLDSARLTVVCPSEWLAALARRSVLLQGAQVETIPYSVPVALYQLPDRAAARASLGLPADAIVLLAGAYRNDERRKGQDHLRAAISRLAQEPALRPDFETGAIQCVVFGSGDVDGDVPIRGLGRLVGDEQLATVYRAADMFLLPTLEDNLPNTLLESLAAGTPVIAYATGGIPEIVGQGSGGLAVPRGDVGAFATAIRSLVQDPQARRRLSLEAEAHARSALDLSVQGTAYADLYRRLLPNHRGPQGGPPRPVPMIETPKLSLEASEAELLSGILASTPLAAWLAREMATEIISQRLLIDARGGEVVALRSELQLRPVRSAAERAALHQRLKRLMTKVVIVGSGDRARRLWEAFTLGGADVVAFVDDDGRRQGRAFLGSTVHPSTWLIGAHFDIVVVPAESDMADATVRSVLALVDPEVVVPVACHDDDALTRSVAARTPDPWSGVVARQQLPQGLRIGIFGTGSAAMKVCCGRWLCRWHACPRGPSGAAESSADAGAEPPRQRESWCRACTTASGAGSQRGVRSAARCR